MLDFSAHFEPNDWERHGHEGADLFAVFQCSLRAERLATTRSRRAYSSRSVANFSAHFEPNDWELVRGLLCTSCNIISVLTSSRTIGNHRCTERYVGARRISVLTSSRTIGNCAR